MRASARARERDREVRQNRKDSERESKRERGNRGELRRETGRETRKTAENIKKEKVIPGIKLRYSIMKLEATTLMRITNPYEDVTIPPISSCCVIMNLCGYLHIFKCFLCIIVLFLRRIS